MTSILEHLEDMNSVCQKPGLHFYNLVSWNLMLGCIPVTLLKGVVYNENSGGPRTEPCDPILITWNWWLRCDIEPLQGSAAHTKP